MQQAEAVAGDRPAKPMRCDAMRWGPLPSPGTPLALPPPPNPLPKPKPQKAVQKSHLAWLPATEKLAFSAGGGSSLVRWRCFYLFALPSLSLSAAAAGACVTFPISISFFLSGRRLRPIHITVRTLLLACRTQADKLPRRLHRPERHARTDAAALIVAPVLPVDNHPSPERPPAHGNPTYLAKLILPAACMGWGFGGVVGLIGGGLTRRRCRAPPGCC